MAATTTGRPTVARRPRLASLVAGVPNNKISIANAAGDAVRALYEQAARDGDTVDSPTLTISVRLAAKGVALTATADRTGA